MRITAAVAREEGQPFTIEELELGEPRPDEVLVRVHAAGLCHTDVAVRDQWVPAPLPAVLGHEGAGTVLTVGSAVTKVRPGDAVVLTFFERQRAEGARSEPWLARQRRKIDGGLAEIARLLGDRDWAVGDRFTLGDIAAGTVVGYLAVRFPELDWRARHPNLARLSDRLEARPSFRNSVPYAQTITDRVV